MTSISFNMAAQYIVFAAGGGHWAIPVDEVQRVHHELAVQPVIGTQAWFLGLAQVDGQLLPVTDLSAWVGGAAARGPVIQLHADIGLCGWCVDDVLGAQLCDVKPADGAKLPAVIMPGSTAFMVEHQNKQYVLIDAAALVQSPAFTAIRKASVA